MAACGTMKDESMPVPRCNLSGTPLWQDVATGLSQKRRQRSLTPVRINARALSCETGERVHCRDVNACISWCVSRHAGSLAFGAPVPRLLRLDDGSVGNEAAYWMPLAAGCWAAGR